MFVPRNQLQPEETDSILNTIDKLRQLGVGSFLELPQIIVCGDQSSGKSSVLNAVSTLQFPIKDGLCTRFATEVIMRPGTPEHIVVSIVPGMGRSHDERTTLEAFRPSDINMDDIGGIIERATVLMGIDPQNPRARRFSDDILRFEVTGANQPSLTLVDLPGLFQAESIYQTQQDIKSVQELVLRYMRNKRSVILAVISAKSDFVLQSVTRMSGDVDPNGLRTLGIITKPDNLDVGSDSEKNFVELAENRLKFLHRGWHVLVNRNHSNRDRTQDQRDDAEKDFLSKGVWSKIPINHKGVFSLRTRLSIALREHIIEGMPDLVAEAEAEMAKCQVVLSRLGPSRASAEDRRRYLMQAAQDFSAIIRSCVNGSYDDKFFNIDDLSMYKRKRLRAAVQDTLMEFSRDMQQHGHARHIVEDHTRKEKGAHPQQVTQAELEDDVMDLMKYSRGRELNVSHNPMIVRDLFQDQSEPWVKLTNDYRLKLVRSTKMCIDLVLLHITDQSTGGRLKSLIIKPSLDKILASLDNMIKRLLEPRLNSHPITYNRSLAENISKAKQRTAEKLFADKYERAINQGGQVVSKDTLKWLFEDQIVIQPMDLSRFAASEAIIEMRAYYKIAKEVFVDNFSRLAIEECLISQIPEIFSPETVSKLDDETMNEIAMETESAAWERAETDNRLELCASALEQLKRIENMRSSVTRIDDVQSSHSSPGSEAADARSASIEQGIESLSRLDPALSEQENEASLANGVAVNEDLLDEQFAKDVSPGRLKRRKQKAVVVSDDNWLR